MWSPPGVDPATAARAVAVLLVASLARALRAGKGVAADDYGATSEDERVSQRRKIDADHSVAMDTGAAGPNPPMLSGRYASRTPRVRLAFPAFFVIY